MASASSPVAKLHYFDGRGRAEAVRWVLAETGIKYEEAYIRSPYDMADLRASGKSMFGQVPLLELEGKNYVQSFAIIQHLARKYNLYGKSNDEASLCDMYAHGLADAYGPFVRLPFIGEGDDRVRYIKMLLEEQVPKYFPLYEAVVAAKEGPFLVGDDVTFVDCLMMAPLECAVEIATEIGAGDPLAPYPGLAALRKTMLARPGIAAHMKTHRKPPGRVTYRREVNLSLGRATPTEEEEAAWKAAREKK